MICVLWTYISENKLTNFLRLLLCVSIGSLFFYFYRQDILELPEIHRPMFFFYSLVLILSGYCFEAYGWKVILNGRLKNVSYKYALISSGKFVFSKYIPGKVWSIAGRAGYIKEKYSGSFIDLASLSLFYQLLFTLAGAIAGVGILYFIDRAWFWSTLVCIFASLGIIFYLYRPVLAQASRLSSYLLKKKITLSYVPPVTSLQLGVLSVICWICWSLAFCLFLISIYPMDDIALQAGLLFPISSVLGVLMLFSPGGLGVREGFIALGLTVLGVPAKGAASISILSRLWFLSGELLFFGLSFLLLFLTRAKRSSDQGECTISIKSEFVGVDLGDEYKSR